MTSMKKPKIAAQVKIPKNIPKFAHQMGGKYFARNQEIWFDIDLIMFAQSNSYHEDDFPTLNFFNGERVTATELKGIKQDLKGHSAKFSLRSGFVEVSRPQVFLEGHPYRKMIRKTIQNRIRAIPELAPLLRVPEEYLSQ